jgi:hypothetical protein
MNKKLVRACTTNGLLQIYPTAMDQGGEELLVDLRRDHETN